MISTIFEELAQEGMEENRKEIKKQKSHTQNKNHNSYSN